MSYRMYVYRTVVTSSSRRLNLVLRYWHPCKQTLGKSRRIAKTMRPPRLISAAITLGVISTCGASSPSPATILPEVQKHLSEAHRCATSGSLEFAIAHANLVLVSDQVSVCLKFESSSVSERAQCTRALNAGLLAWESVLDHSIQFRREEDPAKADIVFRFMSDVRMGRERVAGYTSWRRSIRSEGDRVMQVTFKADVQVRSRDLNRSAMSFESIRQESEHEIGHILGLEDSDRDGDLMGPLNPSHPVSTPRDYEVDAVRRVRNEARQIRDGALAQQKTIG